MVVPHLLCQGACFLRHLLHLCVSLRTAGFGPVRGALDVVSLIPGTHSTEAVGAL
jgi:hypothetical protein